MVILRSGFGMAVISLDDTASSVLWVVLVVGVAFSLLGLGFAHWDVSGGVILIKWVL